MARAYKCDNCGKLMEISIGRIAKMVDLGSGEKVEIIVQFGRPGENLMGCVYGDYCQDCAETMLTELIQE